MPSVKKAPKLWPAEPLKWILIVCGGKPSSPYRLAIWPLSIAPTVRLEFRMGNRISTGCLWSKADWLRAISWWSSALSSPWSCF